MRRKKSQLYQLLLHYHYRSLMPCWLNNLHDIFDHTFPISTNDIIIKHSIKPQEFNLWIIIFLNTMSNVKSKMKHGISQRIASTTEAFPYQKFWFRTIVSCNRTLSRWILFRKRHCRKELLRSVFNKSASRSFIGPAAAFL